MEAEEINKCGWCRFWKLLGYGRFVVICCENPNSLHYGERMEPHEGCQYFAEEHKERI